MNRELGDFVHALRIKKDTSLRKAASEMGFSAMYLSEIESGKKIPSGEILKKLSSFYGVNYFDLAMKCNEASTYKENSRMAVARIVNGLSDEKVKQVLNFIENIEKGEEI